MRKSMQLQELAHDRQRIQEQMRRQQNTEDVYRNFKRSLQEDMIRFKMDHTLRMGTNSFTKKSFF